jgi:hypothetical protein
MAAGESRHERNQPIEMILRRERERKSSTATFDRLGLSIEPMIQSAVMTG